MMQEAFNNAAKHARAGNITILLDIDLDEVLRLTLMDDGRGFDPSAKIHGNGLKKPQRRADELGGVPTIYASSLGTRVAVAFPVRRLSQFHQNEILPANGVRITDFNISQLAKV